MRENAISGFLKSQILFQRKVREISCTAGGSPTPPIKYPVHSGGAPCEGLATCIFFFVNLHLFVFLSRDSFQGPCCVPSIPVLLLELLTFVAMQPQIHASHFCVFHFTKGFSQLPSMRLGNFSPKWDCKVCEAKRYCKTTAHLFQIVIVCATNEPPWPHSLCAAPPQSLRVRQGQFQHHPEGEGQLQLPPQAGARRGLGLMAESDRRGQGSGAVFLPSKECALFELKKQKNGVPHLGVEE